MPPIDLNGYSTIKHFMNQKKKKKNWRRKKEEALKGRALTEVSGRPELKHF